MKHIKINIAKVVSVVVFLSGILNIYSAFYAIHPRRMDLLRDFLPLGVLHGSRTLALLAGFSLLFLSWGLWKRKNRAWVISVTVLSLSLALHLTKGLDIEEDLALLLPLALLLAYRTEFNARSATRRLTKRAGMAVIVLSLLFLYSVGGFFLLQGQFTKPVTWTNIYHDYEYTILGTGQNTLIPKTHRARWFEDSIAAVGFAALLSVLAVMFEPYIFRSEISEEELKRVRDLVLKHGSHPVSYFSLMPDKQYYFSSSHESFLAYKATTGASIVLGDPVGPEGESKKIIEDFIHQNDLSGLSTAFYLATDKSAFIHRGLKFKMLKIGEDAVVKTGAFDLNLPASKNVRNSVNHVKRQGISFSWFSMQDLPWFALHQIQNLYYGWLEDKKSSPMSFSMDFFPFPPEAEGWVLLALDQDKRLQAAFSFFPYLCGRGLALDLMLRRKNAPNGMVDAALAEAVNWSRDHNKEEVSLGLATTSFAGQNEQTGTPVIQKALDFLYNNINVFYNYRSLTAYKSKFNPDWQPRYLVYKSDTELPKIALALAQAMMPEGFVAKLMEI